MKNLFLFFSLVFMAVGCSSDKNDEVLIDDGKNAYERIALKYMEGIDDESGKISSSWGWWKRVLGKDAAGAGVYLSNNTKNANWVGGLVSAAVASVSEMFSLQTANSYPFRDELLDKVASLREVSNSSNHLDIYGFNHYVVVNEVLKDEGLASVDLVKLNEVVYDITFSEVSNLGLNPPFEKEAVLGFINRLQVFENLGSDQFYETMYEFDNVEEANHFKMISNSYKGVFNADIPANQFAAYSIEIEHAVSKDAQLSQQTKDVLLFEMATYRYGYKYYSTLFE